MQRLAFGVMMTLQISPEQMAHYKRNALRRLQQEKVELEQRRHSAWQLSHKAASLLKKEFDVERVVLFGSLVHSDRFTSRSDVDLAAWGLTSKNWLKAMAAVRNLSDEMELNLVDVNCCSSELLVVIEQEGILL